MKRVIVFSFFGLVGIIFLTNLILNEFKYSKIKNNSEKTIGEIIEAKLESNHDYGTNWSFKAKYIGDDNKEYIVENLYNVEIPAILTHPFRFKLTSLFHIKKRAIH